MGMLFKLIKALSRKQAFTLLEMLVALFFFAMVTLSIQSVFANYQRIYQAYTDSRVSEWHQFLLLLEKELARYQFVSADGKEILVQDRQTHQSFHILLKNQKIYKASGHQPYFYGVADWQVTAMEGYLIIELATVEGQVYRGMVIYAP